ncbi:MAG: Crp/Fnr family transcriptional regulator [Lachnospiraceae bacterium]|nr:Crp/Fnr family transcriptional regulator [Lachnospiraceae bacterium]
MTPDEINQALNELCAIEKAYKKNSFILRAGDITESLGLVLSGSVTIESNDMWGNRTILSNVGEGGFFAETYALLENEPLLVDVRANENCQILFFKVGSLKKLKSNMNLWSFKLISNLLMISANKNLHLSGRSFHTSPKTIRGRVMAYLNSVSLKKGSNEFDIPFDRQQLADYLNLERSALSKELGKMKKDGLIEVRKNHFKLMS